MWGLTINLKTPQWVIIVKFSINIDILNPIKRGMCIGSYTNKIFWIDFNYEKLLMFYFQCGTIGHSDKQCKNPSNVANASQKLIFLAIELNQTS